MSLTFVEAIICSKFTKKNLSQRTQVFFVDRNIELPNLVRFGLEQIKSIF